jgi:hypothetical protein
VSSRQKCSRDTGCLAVDTLSVEFIAAQQPKTADPNGTECVVCKDLFTSLVKVLQTPADQQQILQVIETPICDSLGPIRGVCDDLITTYVHPACVWLRWLGSRFNWRVSVKFTPLTCSPCRILPRFISIHIVPASVNTGSWFDGVGG